MAVAEAKDVSDHGPDGRGPRELQSGVEPMTRRRKYLEKPLVQDWREHLGDLDRRQPSIKVSKRGRRKKGFRLQTYILVGQSNGKVSRKEENPAAFRAAPGRNHLVVPRGPLLHLLLVVAVIYLLDLPERVLVEEVKGGVGGRAAVPEPCCVRDPLDDPAVLREGHDIVGPKVQVPPPAGRVLCKEPVNHQRRRRKNPTGRDEPRRVGRGR